MTTSDAQVPEDADRILLVDDDATNLDVLRHTLVKFQAFRHAAMDVT